AELDDAGLADLQKWENEFLLAGKPPDIDKLALFIQRESADLLARSSADAKKALASAPSLRMRAFLLNGSNQTPIHIDAYDKVVDGSIIPDPRIVLQPDM